MFARHFLPQIYPAVELEVCIFSLTQKPSLKIDLCPKTNALMGLSYRQRAKFISFVTSPEMPSVMSFGIGDTISRKYSDDYAPTRFAAIRG